MDVGAWLLTYGRTVTAITLESAAWVMLGLLLGGLIREFLPSSRLLRLLNAPGGAGLGGAVLVGAALPICSCGVVPLAISLFRAGVRIGPVMAFTAATPMINPAAVILSLGLLGPQLTLAYVALGLLLPLALGVIADRAARAKHGDAEAIGLPPAAPVGPVPAGPTAIPARVLAGLRWGLFELGPSVAFYLAIGVLLAGLLMAATPTAWIERYLGGEAWLSMLVVGGLGAAIYVCAVAHIPLVATLLAAGAAPGAAIVFLVTGTATNLPELIALYRTVGRRTVLVYVTALVLASFAAGIAVNAWLLPGFVPVFDPLRAVDLLARAEGWTRLGGGLEVASSLVLAALALAGAAARLRARFLPAPVAAEAGGSCCKVEQPAP